MVSTKGLLCDEMFCRSFQLPPNRFFKDNLAKTLKKIIQTVEVGQKGILTFLVRVYKIARKNVVDNCEC